MIYKIKNLLEDNDLKFLGTAPLQKNLYSYKYYMTWLQLKYNADMTYLEKNLFIRENPGKIINGGAKTAICFCYPYFFDDNKLCNIAKYSRLIDYHKLLKKKSAEALSLIYNMDDKARVFVDSSPIPERSLALKTGSGWLGKNSFFIHKEFGSFVLLGEIITRLDLKYGTYSKQEKSQPCKNCDLCIKSCPTASIKDKFINANSCLSYLSVEHKGPIPLKYWKYFGNTLFGCDICQNVCPYNKGIKVIDDTGIVLIKSLPSFFELATMGKKEFISIFKSSSLEKYYDKIKRNAIMALAVTKDKHLKEALLQNKSYNNDMIKVTCQIAEKGV